MARTLAHVAAGHSAHVAPLLDVWANAERCAVQHRFDDAVLRAYRVYEGIAQWLLESALDHRAGTVEPARLSSRGRRLVQDGDPAKLGPARLWRLLSLEVPANHPTLRRIRPHGGLDAMRRAADGWVSDRHRSILAHGFFAVGPNEWDRARAWYEQFAQPMLTAAARAADYTHHQLPCAWPEEGS